MSIVKTYIENDLKSSEFLLQPVTETPLAYYNGLLLSLLQFNSIKQELGYV